MKKKVIARNRKFLFVLLSLLFTFLLCALMWAFYNNSREQNRKIYNLVRASSELDALKTDVDRVSLEVSTSRHSDCYRTSVKYSSGWIVCSQSLNIEGRAASDVALHESVRALISVIDKRDGFIVPSQEEILSYTIRGEALESFVLNKSTKNSSFCKMESSVFNYSHVNVQRRGKFIFKLACSESHLSNFIYPEA